MHKHFECEHELQFCKECDIPFCKKCGKEWGKQSAIPVSEIPITTPNSTFNIAEAMKDMPKIVDINTSPVRIVNMEKGEQPS